MSHNWLDILGGHFKGGLTVANTSYIIFIPLLHHFNTSNQESVQNRSLYCTLGFIFVIYTHKWRMQFFMTQDVF